MELQIISLASGYILFILKKGKRDRELQRSFHSSSALTRWYSVFFTNAYLMQKSSRSKEVLRWKKRGWQGVNFPASLITSITVTSDITQECIFQYLQCIFICIHRGICFLTLLTKKEIVICNMFTMSMNIKNVVSEIFI